jgi:hypothetical protein
MGAPERASRGRLLKRMLRRQALAVRHRSHVSSRLTTNQTIRLASISNLPARSQRARRFPALSTSEPFLPDELGAPYDHGLQVASFGCRRAFSDYASPHQSGTISWCWSAAPFWRPANAPSPRRCASWDWRINSVSAATPMLNRTRWERGAARCIASPGEAVAQRHGGDRRRSWISGNRSDDLSRRR